jgi:hypothetical protein
MVSLGRILPVELNRVTAEIPAGSGTGLLEEGATAVGGPFAVEVVLLLIALERSDYETGDDDGIQAAATVFGVGVANSPDGPVAKVDKRSGYDQGHESAQNLLTDPFAVRLVRGHLRRVAEALPISGGRRQRAPFPSGRNRQRWGEVRRGSLRGGR